MTRTEHVPGDTHDRLANVPDRLQRSHPQPSVILPDEIQQGPDQLVPFSIRQLARRNGRDRASRDSRGSFIGRTQRLETEPLEFGPAGCVERLPLFEQGGLGGGFL